MTADYLLNAFITLFVVIDPIGLAPMFLAFAGGLDRKVQRQVALRSSLVSGAVLIGFTLVGQPLLEFLGISLAALRIAGGILLFYIAFEMVFERRNARREAQLGNTPTAAERAEDASYAAIVPLAVPLTAGPGAISAAILLSASAPATIDFVGLIIIILVLVGAVFLAFLAAPVIDRGMGVTGRSVLTRLFGVLLAALAVQFVVLGVQGPFTPGVPVG